MNNDDEILKISRETLFKLMPVKSNPLVDDLQSVRQWSAFSEIKFPNPNTSVGIQATVYLPKESGSVVAEEIIWQHLKRFEADEPVEDKASFPYPSNPWAKEDTPQREGHLLEDFDIYALKIRIFKINLLITVTKAESYSRLSINFNLRDRENIPSQSFSTIISSEQADEYISAFHLRKISNRIGWKATDFIIEERTDKGLIATTDMVGMEVKFKLSQNSVPSKFRITGVDESTQQIFLKNIYLETSCHVNDSDLEWG